MENFQFYSTKSYSKYFNITYTFSGNLLLSGLLLLMVIYSFSNTMSVKISDKNYFIAETDQSSTGVSSDEATYSTPGIACNSNTATQISGAVWEDWDYNGAMNEAALTGVKGILVSLYNDCGNVVDATTTDINGDYSFSSLEISTMYRIEFSIPDSLNWAKPTQTGTDSKSMVQFVQSGNCANLGIAAPIDYCDNNPILFTPCYVNGEALGGTDAGTLAAFVGVAKNFSGDGFSGSDNNYAALGEQIGATWGVAVQASTQTVFTSSVLKRHVSFGPADNTVGTTTHTTGGIYAIDYSNPASPNTSLWLDLNTLSGIATGADPHTGLNGNPNQPNNDKGAFPEVAKMALGDLDISEDGKTLYVVNLNDKTLIEIDIATKTVQQIYSIPNPGCTNSDNTIEAAYHFSNTVGTINGSAIGTTWEDGYSLAGAPLWTINTPGLDFNPTDAPSSIFKGTIFGDNLSVPINVPNGNYEVSLYFRDYNNGIGQRVFDISLEGTVVLDDFDIEASNTAKWNFLNASNDGTSNNSYSSFALISNQQTFTISVSDGTLNINLDKEASSVLEALLFGVKVKNLDTTPNPATDYRPWGIGINKGKIYVGAVCSGESSELRDDLSATVFELENGTFSEVLSFPLDYERGFLVRGPNDGEFPATWNTWNDDDTFANWQGFFGSSWYPLRAQPILSDIEFDNDDNMIVAFMDRTGHQIGYNDYTPTGTIKEFNFSGGDVLKACKSGETWNIEGSPACAQPFSGISGPFNYWGINDGEFYGEDYALLSTDANIHDETHWGGLFFDKTTNQLINTAYDTKYIANSGGFSWYDNANGTFIKGYEVYGNVFADPDAVLPLFGKANGLGDVEMLCAPAPLEIGNYVWCDSIENGIQDACERGISGMKVQLFDSNGNLVAVTQTSPSGNYVFNQTNVDTTGVTVGGAANNAYTGLSYETQYFIVFGESQFTNDEFAVNGHTYAITSTPNAGSNDNVDSDVDGSILSTALNAMPAGLPFIDMTTNGQGCGDHKYDLGVTCICSLFNLSSTQASCTDNADGTFTAVYDLELNWSGAPATGDITITLIGDGTLVTSTVSAASIAAASSTMLIGAFTVPADGTGTTTITATFDDDTACTATLTLLKAPLPCPIEIPICTSTADCLGGKVFEDFNCNGVDDTEPGVQGVQIQVYDCNNNLVGTGYSDSDGDWQVCGLTDGTAYRIEHILPEAVACWATPTHVGTDNGSDIQFLTAPACTQFSVSNPADYCEANPNVATNCYVNGSVSGGTAAAIDALVSFPYDASGEADDGGTVPNHDVMHGDIGATWGLAYKRDTRQLFASAFIKRHVGLKNGTGAIFVTDYSGATASTTLWLDINGLSGINTGTDPHGTLPGNHDDNSHDTGAFDAVGKVSIGDLDISEDGKILYAVNLNDKTLISIDIATKTILSQVAIPDPGCTDISPTVAGAYMFGINSASNRIIAGFKDGSTYLDNGTVESSSLMGRLIENTTDAPDNVFDSDAYASSGTSIGMDIPFADLSGVSAGTNLRVTLYFAAYSNVTAANQQNYDITIEGVNVGTVDLWTDAGNQGTTPFERSFNITAAGTDLNIDLDANNGLSYFCGVKIEKTNASVITAPADSRPWGLEVKDGKIYIGVVCSGQSSGFIEDMSANVYEYDGSSFSNILSFPLSYTRGRAYNFVNDGVYQSSSTRGWYPWISNMYSIPRELANVLSGSTDEWQIQYPQPMLSDIAFDDAGNMILGFVDRFGHQMGRFNYGTFSGETNPWYTGQGEGDILKVCFDGSTYSIEGTNSCSQNNYNIRWNGTADTFDGAPEFFDDNFIKPGNSTPTHEETFAGGLAVLSGANEVIGIVIDPIEANSNGVQTWSMTNGDVTNEYELTSQNDVFAPLGNFAKANGLGDIELLCAPAPLEIGNYVWCDSLNNGIQDACERGVSGIHVSLYDRTGALVGVTTTSATGQYYFNETNVDTTGVTPAGAANNSYTGMSYSTQYFIVYGGDGQFSTDEFTVGGEMYGITSMANTGSNDNIDSDVDGSSLTAGSLGVRPDGLPYIDMTTSATGCGEHKYDLGVTCVFYSLGNQVFTDTDNSGDLNGGETGIDGVVLQLLNSDGSVYDSAPNTTGDQALTVTTANGGYYRFDNLPAGDYIVEVLATNFTSGNNLENFLSSTGANQEADPDTDGDLNDNGLDTQVSGATRSAVVSLGTPEPTGEAEPGSYGAGSTTGTAAVDTESNLTVDFGFYPCPTLILAGTTSPTTCNGTDGEIQLSGLSATTIYVLNFTKDAIAQTSQSITTNSSGIYVMTGLEAAIYTTINVTAAGCTSNSVTATLTDSSLPTVTINSPSTCDGVNATVTATPSGGDGTYTYAWTVPAAASAPGNVASFSTMVAGTYTVTITDGNTCANTASGMVIINPKSTATAAITDATCVSGSSSVNSDGTITLSEFTTGEKYDYVQASTYTGSATYATGSTVIPDSGVIVNNLVNPVAAIVYTVRIFTSNECFVDRMVTLNSVICEASIDYPDYSSSLRPCNDEPCHMISTDLYLGQSVSPDANPIIGETADNDDDDGVFINDNMQITPGNTVRFPVTIYNNTGSVAYLRTWIDWNADGDFEDAGEQIENNTYPSTGTADIVFVSVTVPFDAVQTSAIALRARLSTDDANSANPCGIGTCAADGEIEDYLIQLTCPTSICLPIQLTRKSGNP